jgi:hypothetical protein
MILATRPDTLSSSVDICFIKPQDLLALSKAIFVWRFIKDKRPSRSEILNEYSVHRQEERGGEEAPESNILAGGDSRPQPDDPLMTHKYRGSQQSSREVKPKFINLFDTRGAKEYM